MPEHRATTGRRTERARWTRTTSRRIRALLSLGVILGLGATSTMALWSDTSTATSGEFATGTVDIKVGTPAADDNPPQFTTDFALTNMSPGSSTDAALAVSNTGTLPFTFTLAGAAPGTLGAALRISVYPAFTDGACTGTAIVDDVAVNGEILSPHGPLAAGATENLCVRASLPADAPTELQGTSTTVTLTFTATNV